MVIIQHQVISNKSKCLFIGYFKKFKLISTINMKFQRRNKDKKNLTATFKHIFTPEFEKLENE